MNTHAQINKEAVEKILEYLPRVMYLETAAALAGVSHRTLQDWLKRGKEVRRRARRTGEPIPQAEEMYANLAAAIKAVVAHAEMVALGQVAGASQYDWRAAAWMLEKRFPSRWGRDRAEVLALQKRVRELEEQYGVRQAGGR
jgi:hypothetical protein